LVGRSGRRGLAELVGWHAIEAQGQRRRLDRCRENQPLLVVLAASVSSNAGTFDVYRNSNVLSGRHDRRQLRHGRRVLSRGCAARVCVLPEELRVRIRLRQVRQRGRKQALALNFGWPELSRREGDPIAYGEGPRTDLARRRRRGWLSVNPHAREVA